MAFKTVAAMDRVGAIVTEVLWSGGNFSTFDRTVLNLYGGIRGGDVVKSHISERRFVGVVSRCTCHVTNERHVSLRRQYVVGRRKVARDTKYAPSVTLRSE